MKPSQHLATKSPEAQQLDIPSGQGCLYVVELSNGCIKVGRSCNPRTRLKSLDYFCRRVMGVGVTRWIVTGHMPHREARAAETRVIAAVAAVAESVPRRREYFTGITFDAAVTITSEAA